MYLYSMLWKAATLNTILQGTLHSIFWSYPTTVASSQLPFFLPTLSPFWFHILLVVVIINNPWVQLKLIIHTWVWTTHWHMNNLPAPTSLKQNDSSSISNHLLFHQGWSLRGPSSILVGILTDWILCEFWADSHRRSEVMCEEAVACPEDGISQLSPPSISSCILSAHSSATFLEPWMEQVNRDEASMAEPSRTTTTCHFDQMSLYIYRYPVYIDLISAYV